MAPRTRVQFGFRIKKSAQQPLPLVFSEHSIWKAIPDQDSSAFLVATGALPERDEHVVSLEAWVSNTAEKFDRAPEAVTSAGSDRVQNELAPT